MSRIAKLSIGRLNSDISQENVINHNITLIWQLILKYDPFASQGVPSATSPSIADGYWVLLHPLPPGQHQITFGGSIPNFETSVTYNFVVQPGRA